MERLRRRASPGDRAAPGKIPQGDRVVRAGGPHGRSGGAASRVARRHGAHPVTAREGTTARPPAAPRCGAHGRTSGRSRFFRRGVQIGAGPPGAFHDRGGGPTRDDQNRAGRGFRPDGCGVPSDVPHQADNLSGGAPRGRDSLPDGSPNPHVHPREAETDRLCDWNDLGPSPGRAGRSDRQFAAESPGVAADCGNPCQAPGTPRHGVSPRDATRRCLEIHNPGHEVR